MTATLSKIFRWLSLVSGGGSVAAGWAEYLAR